MIFYFHLLIHREYILSYFDFISTLLIIWKIFILYIAGFLIFVININYYHCFNNKILNNQIVTKDEIITIKFSKMIFIYFLIIFNITLTSIYIKAFLFIISLISTIFKHLNKREVMCKKDNIFLY